MVFEKLLLRDDLRLVAVDIVLSMQLCLLLVLIFLFLLNVRLVFEDGLDQVYFLIRKLVRVDHVLRVLFVVIGNYFIVVLNIRQRLLRHRHLS